MNKTNKIIPFKKFEYKKIEKKIENNNNYIIKKLEEAEKLHSRLQKKFKEDPRLEALINKGFEFINKDKNYE